jgi:hypothetical protein
MLNKDLYWGKTRFRYFKGMHAGNRLQVLKFISLPTIKKKPHVWNSWIHRTQGSLSHYY